jgi:RND superfamily putative drug exporter
VSAFLYRLGRSSARHPFRVLGVWVVAGIAIVALQGAAGGHWDNSERVPGVESQHAADVLNDRFPSQGGLSARIVLHTHEGRLDDPAMAATVEQARSELAGGADVAGVTDPFATGTAAVSDDGQTAYLDVTYAVDKLTTAQLRDALGVTDAARDSGVEVELTGSRWGSRSARRSWASSSAPPASGSSRPFSTCPSSRSSCAP